MCVSGGFPKASHIFKTKFTCAYLVSSARSQETYSHDKLSLKWDEMAARWQGTYKEKGQVQGEPKVGEKMITKGVVTL